MTVQDDQHWMRRAEELAAIAVQNGEAAVGTVLVSAQGECLAEAQEAVVAQNDPTAHAETLAIRIACQKLGKTDLAGCSLYTNVEPCLFCAYAIRITGIARVLIGRPIADIGGVTSSFPLLITRDIPDFPAPPEIIWMPQPL